MNETPEPRDPAYDVVGDVHGCLTELRELLGQLGYDLSRDQEGEDAVVHPDGRQVVFVGDLTDRGPDSVGTVRLVHRMWRDGVALVAPGNHDDKLLRYLHGRNVRLQHGIETTVAEYLSLDRPEREAFRQQMVDLVGGSKHYLTLDHGRLIVAHAGIKQHMIGDFSGATRSMVLYGDTTGRTLPDGFPERRDWAAKYRGKPLIVYGHTPVKEAVLRNNTINIDTGCVFGGKLTAFRYPEQDVVQVPAHRVYWPHARFEEIRDES
jgi:protein phosphatase